MTEETRPSPLWLRLLLGATLVLGAVHLGLLVYAIVQRFRFPTEVEWMSGAIFDHVERVVQKKPLYGPPSVDFIPFLYPPLYYWLSALVAKALPIAAACRVVSVTAWAITSTCVYRATRRLGATPTWALVAFAFYIAAYPFTGYWYDLERSDSLLMALLTSGLVTLLETEGLAGAALAGALVGGALFAKQPASVFFFATATGLLAARRVRRAVAFVAGGLTVVVPVFVALTTATHGWFSYYCFKMPASHGLETGLLSLFVVDSTKIFAFVAATAIVLGTFVKTALPLLRDRSTWPFEEKTTVFTAMLAAGFVTSATSRLHVGGHVNVLMFWTTFAAIAFGVAGGRIFATGGLAARGLVVGLAFLQIAHLLYDPGEAVPNAGRVRDAGILEARIRELEQRGPVLVTGRGHVSSPRHFHVMALIDVIRTTGIPDELVRGLREQRYAAYVVDEFGELTLEAIVGHRSELFEHVMRNYFIAERLDDRAPPPVIGWAHPSWVLIPRKHPLRDATVADLERRKTIEMGIAEMRMRKVQAGVEKLTFGDEVEELAAQADHGAP